MCKVNYINILKFFTIGRIFLIRSCSVIPIIYGLGGIGKNLEEL
jgi:hypothetical protein